MDTLLETNLKVNLSTGKMKIHSSIISVEEALTLRFQMWELYRKYYSTDQQSFFDRFHNNDRYAIYWHNEKMIGFTAIRMRSMVVGLKKYMTFYLGQSVLLSDYRGQSLIPKTCVCLFIKHYIRNPFMPIYVWCDALTYKPYLLFANAFKNYYPAPMVEKNEVIAQLLRQIGDAYYSDSFDEETGTVRKATNVIADAHSSIYEKDLQNPAIRFFVEKNPKHNMGHGLLTLAPVSFKNMISLVKHLWIKKLRKNLSFLESIR